MALKLTITTRYVLFALLIITGLHSLLSFTHEDYGRATSLKNLSAQLPWGYPGEEQPAKSPDGVYVPGDPDVLVSQQANATLLMLARNSDVESAVRSVRQLEDRFNRKHRYPWVFLNEEPFSDEFKTRVSNVINNNAEVEFGLIEPDHWFQPDWIDEDRAKTSRLQMQVNGIIYGGSLPYRNMCRYNSGFFFRHALLQKYKWYWRVEPDVFFHCDVDYDPFLFMESHNKTYGFTITLYEYNATIPTLWETTKEFLRANPQYIAHNNAMDFTSDDGGESYSLCHFWSNFEIASMDFWRGEAYMKYFEHLDRAGGFYYERWGDAPVHSIAAALLQSKEQIHFFSDIGYEHMPYTHCPRQPAWARGRCACNPDRSFDYSIYSCMRRWDRMRDASDDT